MRVSESVYEASSEEIMKRLMAAVMDGWMRDLHDSVLVNSWDFASTTIFDLNFWADETLTNENLVDYLAGFASHAASNLSIDKKEFVKLWSKLTPEQRKAFLKELYHNVALYGLKDFLNYVGKGLSLKAVNDYLNGKISFRGLMHKLAKKYGIDKYIEDELSYEEEETATGCSNCITLADIAGEEELEEIADSFSNGISLADFVSDEELKELVRKYVLPQVKK